MKHPTITTPQTQNDLQFVQLFKGQIRLILVYKPGDKT